MKKTVFFEKALWCSKSKLPLKRKGRSFFVRGAEKPRLTDCEGILVDEHTFQRHESVKGKVNLFYSKTPFPEYEKSEDIGTLLSKSRDRVFADLLNRSIPFHSKVLEVGCGTGQLGNFLAISGREILSVDMCLNSLRLGEKFRSEQKIYSIKFMQGDLFDLPLRKDYFDVVICTGSLHHTPDPKKGLETL
jgi:2-polyprenyl-3-methyl-5-hydroxy-6-metoxy-1,4-benzoquinol methylase